MNASILLVPFPFPRSSEVLVGTAGEIYLLFMSFKRVDSAMLFVLISGFESKDSYRRMSK